MEDLNGNYGGFAYVAQFLTEHRPERPRVTRQGVWMWWSRREDFPKQRKPVINGREHKLFLLPEVLEWYDNYVPDSRVTTRRRNQEREHGTAGD